MRKFFKHFIRGFLLFAVILAVVAIWQREKIFRLMAVNSLFSKEKIVNNFSNMETMFLTQPLAKGDGAFTALPSGTTRTLPTEVEAWIKARNVTSLVVLKDGAVVAEDYYLGTGANDLRISWSVAKSFLSALVGIELAQGSITSLDDPVTKYAPMLTGSAYDGTTIRQVLNMASGVRFNEDYLDFNSDINRMGRVLALGGSMDSFAADITERQHEPGKTWQYVSIDTHVIGMVIRGATGRGVAELLEEKIIKPLGLKIAPYYVTDGNGVAFVLGGLNLATRDYARFGQMFMNGGRWNGVQVVPEDWVNASTRATAPTAPDHIGYGYQWWVPRGAVEGEYLARGIYGQYIYVNRPQGVVIATTAADNLFREDGVSQQNVAIFRAIAQGI